MASIRFIVEDDQPKDLRTEGSVLDTMALITYLIGKVYSSMRRADPIAAKAFKSLLSKVVADPDSPVWNMEQHDGEISIAICKPMEDDG